MNNKKIIGPAFVLLLLSAVCSCKKSDYIVGGNVQDVNMYKNMTTYEALQSMPVFDTLVQVIDAAGLKDSINQTNTTFFAPTNSAIYNYLSERTLFVQNNYSLTSKFLLDSLLYYVQTNIAGTRDSLLLYLVKQPLTYASLTDMGAVYPTALPGDTAIVSYEYTKDGDLGYNSLVSSVPQIVYFTHLWYHYDLNADNTATDVPASIGVHTRVQTSGINTRNGVIDVLENSHILFFYGTKQ